MTARQCRSDSKSVAVFSIIFGQNIKINKSSHTKEKDTLFGEKQIYFDSQDKDLSEKGTVIIPPASCFRFTVGGEVKQCY